MNLARRAGHFKLEGCLDFAPFRAALRRAEFTPSALTATLAVQNPAESVDLPMVLLRTEAPTAYHTLTRLFILEQPVPEDRVREAVGPMPLEYLIDCNLLRRVPIGVQATVKLSPFDEFYFVSDFSHPLKLQPLPADYVLGVGPSSLSLAGLTVRRPVETVLDVGSGAGVQAILASAHAKRIVGTDTNARALNFAAFNARLNGLDNFEWREGSFFEPAPERFDLIVFNPPYVISPESSLLYRDGGGQGDSVSEHAVRESPRHLNQNGFAIMLINWHHQSEEDWPVRPTEWMADNGCDGWLIRFGQHEPLLYAANWLHQTESQQPQRYSQLLGEWTQYYTKSGFLRISSGAVILRKRFGQRNWIRHDSLQGTHAGGPCSEHILRIFAGEDFLRSLPGDDALLDHRFSVTPELRVDQRLALSDGKWAAQELTMNLTRGLPFPGHADIQLLQLLARCDGNSTMRECIELVAREFGVAPSAMAPPCIKVTKKLIACGILTPAQCALTVTPDR
jgi:methylase of polypeptide subunit release factors